MKPTSEETKLLLKQFKAARKKYVALARKLRRDREKSLEIEARNSTNLTRALIDENKVAIQLRKSLRATHSLAEQDELIRKTLIL
jgi:hypothetical protein